MFGGSEELIKEASAYGRVSSEDQAERGTIKNQIEFGVKYCDLHQITLNEWYLDDGVTGTIPLDERKDGKRLLDDAKAGKLKTLLIYKLDRLGRSARIILNSVFELEKYGVKIKSMTEPFDTSDPSGRFLLTILAGVADLERETILQRMWLGSNRAAKDGKWLGGMVPYGYYIQDGYLTPSLEPLKGFELSEVDVIKIIYRLTVERHMSNYKIADYLNALGVPPSYAKDNRKILKGNRKVNTLGMWHPGSIRAILISTTYKGIHYYGRRSKKDRDLIPREVPALIDEVTWEKAQIVLKENRIEAMRNRKRNYLLTSLIKCGLCGRSYTGTYYPGSNRELKGYYICGSKSIYLAPGQKKCQSKNVPQLWLDELVWNDIVQFVQHPDELIEELKELSSDTSNDHSFEVKLEEEKQMLSKTMHQKDAEKQSILDLYRKNLITLEDVEQQLNKISSESAQISKRLAEIDEDMAHQEGQIEQLSGAKELLDYLKKRIHDELPFDEKREIVKMLVNKVVVNTKDVDGRLSASIFIEYRFSNIVNDTDSLAAPSALQKSIQPDPAEQSLDRAE